MFLRNFILRTFITLWPVSAISEGLESTDNIELLFQSATQAPHLVHSLDGKPLKWNKSNLKVGFLFPNRSFLDELRALNDTFERNASAITDATRIPFSVGAWWDVDPSPDLFVYIGDPEDIVRISRVIESRFNISGYSAEIQSRQKQGGNLCLPTEVFSNGTLRHTVVTVNVRQDPEFCLARFMAYSMGLTGSLPKGVDSILSVDFSTRNISNIDKAIMAMIYTSN